MRKYFWENFRAWTQLLNATLGGRSNIQFSTRTYIAHKEGKKWGKYMLPFIDGLWELTNGVSDHCKKSYLREIKHIKRDLDYLKGIDNGSN